MMLCLICFGIGEKYSIAVISEESVNVFVLYLHSCRLLQVSVVRVRLPTHRILFKFGISGDLRGGIELGQWRR